MSIAPNRDYSLVKVQQNEVFRILTKSGLSSSDFRWDRVHSGGNWNGPHAVVSRLTYAPQPRFGFIFDVVPGDTYVADRSPGITVPAERVVTQTWVRQLGAFAQWASVLRQEIAEPDLWAEAAAQLPRAILPAPPAGSSPDYWSEGFTADELDELKIKLNAFQHSVEDKVTALFDVGELNAETKERQLAFVREQIGELGAASQRQSRLSWYQLAIGVAFTIVTAIPTDHRVALLHAFAGLVLGVTGLLGK